VSEWSEQRAARRPSVVETDPNADISERRQLRKRGKPREGQATKGFRMQLKTSGDDVKTTKKVKGKKEGVKY